MLDKAIASGKEHRKEYRGIKAILKSTRNHGGDSYSYRNYVYSSLKRLDESNSKLNDYHFNA